MRYEFILPVRVILYIILVGSPKVRKRRNTEDTSTEKTIETLLVIDQKMAQHYGLDAARQYALTVGDIVCIPCCFDI